MSHECNGRHENHHAVNTCYWTYGSQYINSAKRKIFCRTQYNQTPAKTLKKKMHGIAASIEAFLAYNIDIALSGDFHWKM